MVTSLTAGRVACELVGPACFFTIVASAGRRSFRELGRHDPSDLPIGQTIPSNVVA